MSDLLLDLESLNPVHQVSKINKQKTFEDILKKCHNKIKKYNKEFKKQECLFAPPPMIIGVPPYNYVDLIDYLTIQLKKNGLRVEWLKTQRSLYISWKPCDVDLQQYQSQCANPTPDPLSSDQIGVSKVAFTEVIKAPLSTSSNQTQKKGKKNQDKPALQHVAVLAYGQNTQDMIPINLKAYKQH